MGPTVSQMFGHHAGTGVTHASRIAAAAPSSGLWVWVLVLLVLLGLFVWVRRGLRSGLGSGTLGRGFMGPYPPGSQGSGRGRSDGLVTGGWAAVVSVMQGVGRSGRTASSGLLRRVGLSQEGSLRVESRVQLAPGRWLVRVRTGEEALLLSIGPDVHVIGARPDPNPEGEGREGQGPGAEVVSTGTPPFRSEPPGRAFARILGESLSRLGQDDPEQGP